ncbi:hypothetical protein FACS1894176_09740 [Bacteroidia bacterium]|nr:hypothetical protein FACS1894176_09740 [Bacteroidia bacterium]
MRYANKIKDRELTEKEYNKIMKEIAEEGSILPMSHKRNFSY